MDPSENWQLVQCELNDLVVDNTIYIRGRRAVVVSLDYPLVFFRFADEYAVKHRSFLDSRSMFQVARRVENKGDMPPPPAFPLDASFDSDSIDPALLPADAIHAAEEHPMVEEHAEEAVPVDESLDVAPPPPQQEERVSWEAFPSPEDATQNLRNAFLTRSPKLLFRELDSMTLRLDDLRMTHALHIESCRNCVFVVPSKINSISIYQAQNVVVHFTGLISSLELISSQHCHIVCSQRCSSFVLDKSSDCRVTFPLASEHVLVSTTLSPRTVAVASAEPGQGVPQEVALLADYFANQQPAQGDAASEQKNENNAEKVEYAIVADVNDVQDPNSTVSPQYFTTWEHNKFRTERMIREGDVGYFKNFEH